MEAHSVIKRESNMKDDSMCGHLDMQYGSAGGVGIVDGSQQLPTGQIPHGDLISHTHTHTISVNK